MQVEKAHQALVRKVKRILKTNGIITVYGWKDSNHNETTRAYANTGRVKFVERNLKLIGVSADFVICTTFIKHADSIKLSKHYDVYTPCLSLGEIREVLYTVQELIFKPKQTSSRVENEASQADDSVPSDEPSLSYLETQLYNGEVTMDMFDQLAEAFKESAVDFSEDQPHGMVSSRKIKKILEQIGFQESATVLCNHGWLSPHILEGNQKIGWYLPGEKLISRINLDPVQEPKDPIDKARFLIDRRPFIEARIAEARREMEGWQKQLERVDAAESLIKQLEDV